MGSSQLTCHNDTHLNDIKNNKDQDTLQNNAQLLVNTVIMLISCFIVMPCAIMLSAVKVMNQITSNCSIPSKYSV
jgi:hypothetical protein